MLVQLESCVLWVWSREAVVPSDRDLPGEANDKVAIGTFRLGKYFNATLGLESRERERERERCIVVSP